MPISVFYTCPMHPEVEIGTPGVCPQCGLKLVPEPRKWHDSSMETETPRSTEPWVTTGFNRPLIFRSYARREDTTKHLGCDMPRRVVGR